MRGNICRVSHSFWKPVVLSGNQYQVKVARQEILVARHHKYKDINIKILVVLSGNLGSTFGCPTGRNGCPGQPGNQLCETLICVVQYSPQPSLHRSPRICVFVVFFFCFFLSLRFWKYSSLFLKLCVFVLLRFLRLRFFLRSFAFSFFFFFFAFSWIWMQKQTNYIFILILLYDTIVHQKSKQFVAYLFQDAV